MTVALCRIGCVNRYAKRVKLSEFLAWARTVFGKHSQEELHW